MIQQVSIRKLVLLEIIGKHQQGLNGKATRLSEFYESVWVSDAYLVGYGNFHFIHIFTTFPLRGPPDLPACPGLSLLSLSEFS